MGNSEAWQIVTGDRWRQKY